MQGESLADMDHEERLQAQNVMGSAARSASASARRFSELKPMIKSGSYIKINVSVALNIDTNCSSLG